MPYISQTTDLTTQYKSYPRAESDWRPGPSITFTPGLAVKLASQDVQIYPDAKTIVLTATGAGQESILGVVSDDWTGFTPGGSFASPATAPRGTTGVRVVSAGYHPGVLVDQSGTGAVTITNGIPLVASRATAGYSQGVAAASAPGAYGCVGVASLPASGIGSSLTAAALAQASQTDTLTGTPAVGDTLSVTIESPYIGTAPGVAQTTTWTTPGLNTAQAVSVTTAAAALRDYLNGQASFSKYFTATASAGVLTVTVNSAAALFRINFGSGTTVTAAFDIAISGMVANSLTFAVAATGGTIATAGGANLAGGTGYLGPVPALVC